MPTKNGGKEKEEGHQKTHAAHRCFACVRLDYFFRLSPVQRQKKQVKKKKKRGSVALALPKWRVFKYHFNAEKKPTSNSVSDTADAASAK